MDEHIKIVRDFYDQNAAEEWKRLEDHPFEFELTTYMMRKHIKPGDSVLDIGGGPGRYAIYLAGLGCDVTLVDLSEGNIAFARQQAKAANVSLRAYAANCLELDALPLGEYDHVLLMGPLYHLVGEDQRVKAVEDALGYLKPGGVFYASFILAFAGIIYDLKNGGMIERDRDDPATAPLLAAVVSGDDYAGKAFTSACFMHQNHILPFMARFPLKQLHFFGQEGILAPNEKDILAREPSERECWLDLAKRFLERPELLAYSEHAMYIGQKA